MIVACLLSVLIQGSWTEAIMTGNVKQVIGNYYVVDFSNSASGIGAQGEYFSNYLVLSERCAVKTYGVKNVRSK